MKALFRHLKNQKAPLRFAFSNRTGNHEGPENYTTTFQKLANPQTPPPERVAYLRALLNDKLTYDQNYSMFRDVLTMVLTAPEVGQAVASDPEMLAQLQIFKEKCLQDESGKGFEMAIYLNHLAFDEQMIKTGTGQIIKKLNDFINNSSEQSLSKNIDLLYRAGKYYHDNQRSDLTDQTYKKLLEILPGIYNTLSISNRLIVLTMLSEYYKSNENDKVNQVMADLIANLKEGSFSEVMGVITTLSHNFPEQMMKSRSRVESTALSFLPYVSNPNDLATLFSGVALWGSDKFWEKITPMLLNVFDTLEADAKGDIVYLFALAKRGSDTAWETFYKSLQKNLENLSPSAKLKLFFANLYVQFETDLIDFSIFENEIYTKSFIEKLELGDCLILLENVFDLKSISQERRKFVVSTVREITMGMPDEIKNAVDTIVSRGSMQKS